MKITATATWNFTVELWTVYCQYVGLCVIGYGLAEAGRYLIHHGII